jgi:class 3 adenylate cyclase
LSTSDPYIRSRNAEPFNPEAAGRPEETRPAVRSGTAPSAAEAKPSTVYLALVKSLNHEAILARYRKDPDDVRGAIELSNQFARIFEDARTNALVQADTFARHAPGWGYFTTGSADEAEALAAEMIRVAEVHNSTVPDLGLRKSIGAVIIASETTSPPSDDLASEPRAGEVRVSDGVYKSLSADAQKYYEHIAHAGDQPTGRAVRVAWRRQVIASAPPSPTITRAVMVIDMARFSRIQESMKLMLGGASSGTLDGQIVNIIARGFLAAGANSYEQYQHSWGGDGGTYFFESPELAHRVSVEILKQAEEQQNKQARANNFEDAMRCFRIGIDFGRLQLSAERGEYAGEPLTRAQRLESGGPTGEVRVTEEFYGRLSTDLRRAYGDTEPILGKSHDHANGIPGRRLAVAGRAPWTEVGRDNKPFPPIKQPNSEFPVAPVAAPAIEYCFVISPLGEDRPRVAQVFDQLIAPACKQAGYTARRATDIPGDRKSVIAENLWNAPLVIAYLGDPLDWNYNVILEVGIRLATGLPLVMLSDGLDGGRDPDYQRLLPFQIVHDNVITVPEDPGKKVSALLAEIGTCRARVSQSWESPNPVIEFHYNTFDDLIITDANETARTVFGAENLRKGQAIDRLRSFLNDHTDPVQAEARREEQTAILDAFLIRASRGKNAPKGWKLPKARIPIVFRDAEIDPSTGKPVGYLPIILRYQFEEHCTRVRYLYLRVSAVMQKPDNSPYYVCDI